MVLNFPAHIPSASGPNAALFADFLQARGRTTARNRLDPALSHLASARVMTYVKGTITTGSVQGIGSVVYTIKTVRTGASGISVITGCVDQSKLAQVRKDGSHFVDDDAKHYPTLKMTANIQDDQAGHRVTFFSFAVGTC